MLEWIHKDPGAGPLRSVHPGLSKFKQPYILGESVSCNLGRPQGMPPRRKLDVCMCNACMCVGVYRYMRVCVAVSLRSGSSLRV